MGEISRQDVENHREECSKRLRKIGINQQVKLCKAACRLQEVEFFSGILIYQYTLDCLAPPDDPPRIITWEELEREASKGE